MIKVRCFFPARLPKVDANLLITCYNDTRIRCFVSVAWGWHTAHWSSIVCKVQSWQMQRNTSIRLAYAAYKFTNLVHIVKP